MKKGTKQYRFIKDYPLAGKKKGDVIPLAKVSLGLKDYVEEIAGGNSDEETPTEKWKNEEIVLWLDSRGVVASGTKEELLKEVKKVLKSK